MRRDAPRLTFRRPVESLTGPDRTPRSVPNRDLVRGYTLTLRQACSRPKPRAQYAFKDSMVHVQCRSHYVSHFAAFFIVARAKTSVVESCYGFEAAVSNTAKPHRFSSWLFVCVGGGAAARGCESPGHALNGSRVGRMHRNDPSAGSPTETLLRLLLPLNDKV